MTQTEAKCGYNDRVLDWAVTGTRITIFVAPEANFAFPLWRSLVGEDPESSNVQKTGVKTEVGPFGKGSLTIRILPNRIDLIYGPVDESPLTTTVATLGQFPDSAEPLLTLFRRWCQAETFPPTNRIALGLILFYVVGEIETGYAQLSSLINGVPQGIGATDFLYQINVPRPSKSIQGLRLNRLSKWSVDRMHVLLLSSAGPQFGPETYHIRLELDLNTGAEYRDIIVKERLTQLLDEMLEAAQQLAQEGTRGIANERTIQS